MRTHPTVVGYPLQNRAEMSFKKGKSNMTLSFFFRLARWPRHPLLIVSLLAVMLGCTAFAAPAAQMTAASTIQTRHCAVVLAPLQAGEQASRVLSWQCVQGNQLVTVPDTSTLLMTLFSKPNFTGTATQIFGNAGPCASTGYAFSTIPVSFNSSPFSYTVSNQCHWVRLFDATNETGACVALQGNISGVSFNLRSMRLAAVFQPC